MTLLVALTVFRYLQKIKYMKGRTQLSQKDNLYTSGEVSNLVSEVVLLLLQPYPFFCGKVFFIYKEDNFCIGIKIDMVNDVENDNYFYSLNDFLALLVVVRLYLVIRMLLNYTTYRSPQARRVSYDLFS